MDNTELLQNINKNLELLVNHFIKNQSNNDTENVVEKTVKKKEKRIKTKKVKSKSKSTNKYNNKKTYLTEYKNALLIHGNTFDYKDEIKGFGGFWNGLNKGWIVSSKEKDNIIINIKGIVVSDVKLEKVIKDENGDAFIIKRKSPKKIEKNMCLFDSDSD